MISILGTTQILYTFFTLIFSIGKIVFLLRRIKEFVILTVIFNDSEQIETSVFKIRSKLFLEYSLNHTLKQIWITNSDNVE